MVEMNIAQIWRQIISTRYASTLEAEVARLRAENRALLNSILGIAGLPPLPATAADLAASPATAPTKSHNSDPQASAPRAATVGTQVPSQNRARAVNPVVGPQIAVPMRKRSWQQITRMLEFESARKEKPAADAVTKHTM
jgi:hypothetical protein